MSDYFVNEDDKRKIEQATREAIERIKDEGKQASINVVVKGDPDLYKSTDGKSDIEVKYLKKLLKSRNKIIREKNEEIKFLRKCLGKRKKKK